MSGQDITLMATRKNTNSKNVYCNIRQIDLEEMLVQLEFVRKLADLDQRIDAYFSMPMDKRSLPTGRKNFTQSMYEFIDGILENFSYNRSDGRKPQMDLSEKQIQGINFIFLAVRALDKEYPGTFTMANRYNIDY